MQIYLINIYAIYQVLNFQYKKAVYHAYYRYVNTLNFNCIKANFTLSSIIKAIRIKISIAM